LLKRDGADVYLRLDLRLEISRDSTSDTRRISSTIEDDDEMIGEAVLGYERGYGFKHWPFS
jgi:hypothetical protein